MPITQTEISLATTLDDAEFADRIQEALDEAVAATDGAEALKPSATRSVDRNLGDPVSWGTLYTIVVTVAVTTATQETIKQIIQAVAKHIKDKLVSDGDDDVRPGSDV